MEMKMYNNISVLTKQTNFIVLPKETNSLNVKLGTDIVSRFDVMTLTEILNYKHTEANPFPSQELLANTLGVSKSYIKQSIKRLVQANLISVVKQGKKNHYDLSNYLELIGCYVELGKQRLELVGEKFTAFFTDVIKGIRKAKRVKPSNDVADDVTPQEAPSHASTNDAKKEDKPKQVEKPNEVKKGDNLQEQPDEIIAPFDERLISNIEREKLDSLVGTEKEKLIDAYKKYSGHLVYRSTRLNYLDYLIKHKTINWERPQGLIKSILLKGSDENYIKHNVAKSNIPAVYKEIEEIKASLLNDVVVEVKEETTKIDLEKEAARYKDILANLKINKPA